MDRFSYEVSWARVVSDILSPPVILGALAFPVAFKNAESNGEAILWASVYIFLVCVLPILYIAAMVKLGKITDIHLKVRRQRLIPFMVSIFTTTVAGIALALMGAPSIMPLLTLFTGIQLAVTLAITFIWQISMHTTSITGATTATWIIFGTTPALLALPLIPLVGLARLKLNRHTPAQVIAGTMVGIIIPIILFSLATVEV